MEAEPSHSTEQSLAALQLLRQLSNLPQLKNKHLFDLLFSILHYLCQWRNILLWILMPTWLLYFCLTGNKLAWSENVYLYLCWWINGSRDTIGYTVISTRATMRGITFVAQRATEAARTKHIDSRANMYEQRWINMLWIQNTKVTIGSNIADILSTWRSEACVTIPMQSTRWHVSMLDGLLLMKCSYREMNPPRVFLLK